MNVMVMHSKETNTLGTFINRVSGRFGFEFINSGHKIAQNIDI